MTPRYREQSKMRSEATTDPLSTKPANASGSDTVLLGRPPATPPARVADFDELDKKALDVLVDSLKYVATTSGIVIAMYSPTLSDYMKLESVKASSVAQVLIYSPLLFWFAAILGTVLGIFPREYHAVTDAEKERIVQKLRRAKIWWVRVVVVPFLLGFALFLYITAAHIWALFPFYSGIAPASIISVVCLLFARVCE
jgi:hypothetical protein